MKAALLVLLALACNAQAVNVKVAAPDGSLMKLEFPDCTALKIEIGEHGNILVTPLGCKTPPGATS